MRPTRRLLGTALLLLFPAVARAGEDEGKAVVRLVDSAGKPVPYAQVYVRATDEADELEFKSESTDEGGIARFSGLDAKRKYAVEVCPTSTQRLATTKVQWIPTSELVVTLPPGRVIRGRSVDESGRPKQAWVHQRVPGAASSQAVTTIEDGEFVFTGLPAGPIELIATPWFGHGVPSGSVPESARWTGVPADVGTVDVTITPLPKPPAVDVLRVHVTGPDGSIPARVMVDLRQSASGTTVTALSGLAELDVRLERDAIVRVYSATYGEGRMLPWAPAEMRVVPGQRSVEIRMGRGFAIAGRVVDGEGRPVPSVTVLANDPDLYFFPRVLSRARTGPDGEFRLVGLGSEEVEIGTAATTDYPESVRVRAAGGSSGLIVTVHPATATRVRVVDSSGRAVAGARVVLMHRRGPHDNFATGVLDQLSGSDGFVDVPAFDPTAALYLQLSPPASRDDLSPREVDPWSPHSGDVVMPPGFVATLRVTDEDGRPVSARMERITVPLEPEFPWGVSYGTERSPDAAGVLSVRGLPFGRTRFRARPTGSTDVFPACSQLVEVDEGHREAHLRLPARGKRMIVRSDPADGPVASGYILADVGNLFTQPVTRELAFGRDGVATIDGVAPGAYVVFVVRMQGRESRAGRVDSAAWDGEEIRVRLVPTESLRVRVTGGGEREDLKATVYVRGTNVWELTRAKGGYLEARGLPPGRYGVDVSARDGDRRVVGRAVVATGIESTIELRPVEDSAR